MTADLFEPYRPILLSELRRVMEGVTLQHGAVLRQQAPTNAGEHSDDIALMPALLCLLTCETFGGQTEDALPAAVSLAFLARMADVFKGIAGADSGTDGTLMRSWGMPRALNGGDAFFALAQASLLDGKRGGLDPDRRFAAVGILDRASRALSEKLYGRSVTKSGAGGGLFAAATALGALWSGADDATVDALGGFGASIDAGVPDVEGLNQLPVSKRAALIEAANCVSEAMR
jgi:hypothetical protein